MKIRELLGALCMTAAVASVAWAQRAPLSARPAAAAQTGSVSCGSSQYKSQEAFERRALRTAPRGAQRASAHDLTVNVAAGVRRFTDRKPYREELSGFHWLYCGYLPALHANLIGMFDEDLFSGKLLLDGNGAVLEAGDTVYPSPDGKRFLAASHRNGEVNDHWMISDLSGRRLWTGLPEGGADPLLYGEPVWISDDVVRVPATCNDSSGKKGHATVARQGNTWRWKNDLSCGG